MNHGQFRQAMADVGLRPLWEVLSTLVPSAPEPSTTFVKWDYNKIRPILLEAGCQVTAEDAIRRVLVLENPGRSGTHAASGVLYAGLQLVLPGEIAPCHRHAQSAVRFMLEGTGITSVEGEEIEMQPFDLILTPANYWHDHSNRSDAPVIWLDGLDIPLLQILECGFAEELDDQTYHRNRPSNTNRNLFGTGLRPTISNSSTAAPDRLLHYKFADYCRGLNAVAATRSPDLCHGYRIEFIDPATGGSVLPTMSAFATLLPKAFQGKSNRTTEAQILTVCEGELHLTVSGRTVKAQPKDIVVIPPWAEFSFATDQRTIFFSLSDANIKSKLGLLRFERNSN